MDQWQRRMGDCANPKSVQERRALRLQETAPRFPRVQGRDEAAVLDFVRGNALEARRDTREYIIIADARAPEDHSPRKADSRFSPD